MADSPAASSSLFGTQGERKSCRHVATLTESWLEFFQHKKYFAVESARLVFRLDIHRPNLAAVLSCRQVGACAVVGVIKTEPCRIWSKHNSPFAMRRNGGRAFFSRSVHFC